MATQQVKNKATGEVTTHDEVDAAILIASGKFEKIKQSTKAKSDELGD